MFGKIIYNLIKEENRKDKEVLQKHKLFLNSSILCMLITLFYAFSNKIMGYELIADINILSVVIGLMLSIYYIITNALKRIAWIVSFLLLSNIWLIAYTTGGNNSPILPWLIISPVFAFLFINYLAGIFMMVMIFVSLTVSFFYGEALQSYFPFYSVKDDFVFHLLSYGGLTLFLLSVIFLMYDRSVRKHKKHLLQENYNRDNLIEKIKEYNEKLENEKSKAEELVKAKSQFLSAMSHEIRTPMNTIIGMTHLMLQDTTIKKEHQENLRILKFSFEGLLALINDILDFSKIESGKVEIEALDFNIRDLLGDIVNSLKLRSNEKNIELKCLIDSEIPEVLIGDPTRLAQVMNNLIGNAVKFTEKGSVKVDVVLEKMKKDFCSIKFTVEDTGIGIDKENQEKIFESFTQAGTYITRRFGGTGLGLAISRKLLEMQNSSIHVESEPGKGSKFFFTLQMKKSQIVVSNKSSSEPKANIYESIKGVSVLLVDDNELNQIIAHKFLTKWEVDVDIANNGLEALEMASKKDYTLILMDLQMPYLDGYEATSRLREMGGKFQTIPIIALTASALLDVHDRIILTGMNDHITKPFIPNELYNKVRKWSEARRA